MNKILLGILDESLVPQVKEELIIINQRRMRILIGVIFTFQLSRELFSLLFHGAFTAYMGPSFAISDILELIALLLFFFLVTFFSNRTVAKYFYFHLFLTLWVFSLIFSLFSNASSSTDYAVVLTMFMNVMLINLFFHLHPIIASIINTVIFGSLIVFEIQADALGGFLLFSVISTLVLLLFVDINLYRTIFFQVYYRIENLRQVELIQEQNIELEAQNEEIHAQQASLKEYADRIETLIMNIPGVVYRSKYDNHWTMVFISKRIEELSGYKNNEFYAEKIRYADIIFSDDKAKVKEIVDKHIIREEPFILEYRIETKSGKIKWVREYGQGINGKNGSIEWLDGVIIDVDEEKRIARLRDDVERTVRHDLKNPLNAIIGFSTILQETEVLDEEEKEYVSMIKQSGYKMLHMINNSLDLFKMEEGNYVFSPKACDLISIIKTVMMEHADKLSDKKLNVDFTCGGNQVTDDTIVNMKLEEYNIESLFSNLLSNAVDASPPGATITITITVDDPVKIEIHNSGAVPEEIRDIFFSRYATSGKKQGTGLGTYSARLIARTHGGDITFTTSESEGTKLVVTLPA